MGCQNYIALQTKIHKAIERLRKQAQALHNKRRKPVIASIVRSMNEYDITPDEIVSAFGKTSTTLIKSDATVKTAKSAIKKNKPISPKYRHPESGATWTGRGSAPRWIVEAENDGKSRQQFLIPEVCQLEPQPSDLQRF